MGSHGVLCGHAVHATAVAISGRALAIAGASGSGKSSLAFALMALSTLDRPVELVGDDRVIVVTGARGAPTVCPHPRIAGFMERRGLGIVAVPHRPVAPLCGLVALSHGATRPMLDLDLPILDLVDEGLLANRRDRVCAWWKAVLGAADETHQTEKCALTARPNAKD